MSENNLNIFLICWLGGISPLGCKTQFCRPKSWKSKRSNISICWADRWGLSPTEVLFCSDYLTRVKGYLCGVQVAKATANDLLKCGSKCFPIQTTRN